MNTDVLSLIDNQKDKFNELGKYEDESIFANECFFAKQQLMNNSFLMKTAANNQVSLVGAIRNVAAVGISLSLESKHAYLVPRDGRVCLDISFRGLTWIAEQCQVIQWAMVDLVYENDEFTYNGPDTAPDHKAEVFGDRGEFKGAYCKAKLSSGDFLITIVTAEEIYKIRSTSMAFKKNSGPWVDWFEEMVKKSVIKRAFKSWPHGSSHASRLEKAVEVSHNTDGNSVSLADVQEFTHLLETEESLSFWLFTQSKTDRQNSDLYNSFPKGKKVTGKKAYDDLVKKGWAEAMVVCDDLQQLSDADDEMGVKQIEDEFTKEELNFIYKLGN